MLSGDEDDISERLATAMRTANSSGRGVTDDVSTRSAAPAAHESDSSPANKAAKVAFSPFEQASSSKDVSTPV